MGINKYLQRAIGSRIFTAALLLTILLVGFYIRFDNLYTWLDYKPEFFTSRGTPITLGVDPYYYLDIAKDLLSGKIVKHDLLRNFPAGGDRPSEAPLLSVLLAAITFLTGQPLDWVAVLIPPFLGILLAIPVYFLAVALTLDASFPGSRGRPVDLSEAKFAGGVAALFALLSPPLVIRSSIGWCDTDILNVAFAAACILPALAYFRAQKPAATMKYFIAWLAALVGFAWWWDQALAPVLFLGFTPMLLAIMLAGKRLSGREKTSAILVVLLLLILFAWYGDGLQKVSTLYSYVFGADVGSPFPSFKLLVDEQVKNGFLRIAGYIGGNPYLYIGSLVGLVLLLFLAGRRFVFLLPLVALNVLIFQGMRFMIFAAPLFGLGLGTLSLLLLLLLRRFSGAGFATVVVIALFLARLPIAVSQSYNGGRPVFLPGVYDGMMSITTKTPKNSVIWSSWGHGHPLVYYSGRRTIGDGMFHSAALDYISKFPLATDSFRESANWISFYVANGQKGFTEAFRTLTGDPNNWAVGVDALKKFFAAGVSGSREILANDYDLKGQTAERFLAFLFPVDIPPVYLFLDYKLARENWYKMGRWNLARKAWPANFTLIPIESFNRFGEAVQGISTFGTFSVDLRKGIYRQISWQKSLAQVVIDDGVAVDRIGYPERGRAYYLYLLSNTNNRVRSGLFVDREPADTVMVKLFYEKQSNQYFDPLDTSQLPLFMFCKVNGDKYSPSAHPDVDR